MSPMEDVRSLFKQDRLLAVIDSLGSTSKTDIDPELSYILGDCLRQVGRRSDAKDYLLEAIDRGTPESRFNAAMSLSFLLKDLGQFNQAGQLLDSLIPNCGSMPGWFWVIRSAVAAQLEQFDLAIELLDRAEKSMDVDLDEVYFNKATIYRAIGDRSQSERFAEMALEIGSDFASKAEELKTTLH